MKTTKEKSEVKTTPTVVDHQFDLAKRIRRGLGKCAREVSNNGHASATYLWVCVSKEGMGEQNPEGLTTRLSVDQWLNVVDEAASIGVSRLVVSAKHALSDFPDMWQICAWAQKTHGMVVVLHTNAETITEEELGQVRALDTQKTRMLITEAAMASAKVLEKDGVLLSRVDKGPLDRNPCEKPGKMVFVNPEGVLYTCGLVEGIEAFHLGDIFGESFSGVMKDPNLPHAVPDQGRFFAERHACDGCPALAKEIFEDEA